MSRTAPHRRAPKRYKTPPPAPVHVVTGNEPVIEIVSLDMEARGVGRTETEDGTPGKVIFVEGALPGERVSYSTHRSKPKFEQAEVVQVFRESVMRTKPKCTYFDICGGCSMQHLDIRAQVAVKQRVLEDNLQHLAKLRPETVFRPIHGPSWGYRYRARLAVRFLPNDEQDCVARKLDWMGLFLLSPGLMLVLFGAEHFSRPSGIAAIASGALSLAIFLYVEKNKGADALIDLGLFRQRVFSAAALTQFFSNGVLFAGQMLIPLFLVQACAQSPAAMGLMLAPMGLGMMVAMPSLGYLTGRLGDRPVAVAGALFSLVSTLALAGQAAQGLDRAVLAGVLFVRGLGLGAVGLPAISLAYASVEKGALPMATTTLNIVQRVGGPVLTTFCALFLSWALQEHVSRFGLNAWAWAFLALGALHAVMVLAAMLLPPAHAD